jgi:hypothetical protein
MLSFFPLWALGFVWQLLLVDWGASSVISALLARCYLGSSCSCKALFCVCVCVCVCVLGSFFFFSFVPYTLDSLWAFFVFQLFWTLSVSLSLSFSRHFFFSFGVLF